VGLKKDGEIIAVEVELSNANLIRNVKKDLDNGATRLIIAAKGKTNITKYKKELKKTFSQEMLNKVEFKILSEYLEKT
jgi:phosphosulfolactate synthase (CoM biosynthesis protein A)